MSIPRSLAHHCMQPAVKTAILSRLAAVITVYRRAKHQTWQPKPKALLFVILINFNAFFTILFLHHSHLLAMARLTRRLPNLVADPTATMYGSLFDLIL